MNFGGRGYSFKSKPKKYRVTFLWSWSRYTCFELMFSKIIRVGPIMIQIAN